MWNLFYECFRLVFFLFLIFFFFSFVSWSVLSHHTSVYLEHMKEGPSTPACLMVEHRRAVKLLFDWRSERILFCLVVITTFHSVQMLQCISLHFHFEYELFVSLHLTLFDHQAWCANQEKVSVFYSMWAGTLNTVSNCGTINIFCGLRWAYAHFAVASPPKY